jgi:hypothetical protein
MASASVHASARRLDLVRGLLRVAQVREQLGGQVPVGEFAVECEGSPVATDRLPGLAGVLVDDAEALPGLRLGAPVTRLGRKTEGCRTESQRVRMLASERVEETDGVERGSFALASHCAKARYSDLLRSLLNADTANTIPISTRHTKALWPTIASPSLGPRSQYDGPSWLVPGLAAADRSAGELARTG